MSNPVMQFQIISKDPEGTSQFYANLFGWNVNADNPMGYREINTGATEGIQGGIWPAPPQSPNFVQLFILVDDVKAYSAKAESLGAKVLIPCAVLPDGGSMSVLHDSQGMPFGLWQRPAESR